MDEATFSDQAMRQLQSLGLTGLRNFVGKTAATMPGETLGGEGGFRLEEDLLPMDKRLPLEERIKAASGLGAGFFGGAGMLAGPKAVGAPLSKMAQADKFLEWRGNKPTPQQTLWRQFGVAPGKEGKMRFEISDKGARLLREGGEGDLQVILQHPELYRAYPDLARVPTKLAMTPGSKQGSYSPAGIEMSASSPKEAISGLLHEAQHHIQNVERFAGGGNPQAIANSLRPSDIEKYLQTEYNRVVKAGMPRDEAFYYIEDEIAPRALSVLGGSRYTRRAGEVEARNVERRWADPDLQRFAPAMTEDVPRNLQIMSNIGRR